MKITFDPADGGPCGVASFAAWESPAFQMALRKHVFRERPNEEIVELVISRDGIKALFDRREG